MNKYDVIIIGAGASGLFAGASLSKAEKALILEKTSSPGKKLLMSGSGQCNLTHGGTIKDFLVHYGTNGKKIRNILYKYNNLAVIDFFESLGISCFEREDGKVFPKTLKAKDVLQGLLTKCKKNHVEILCNCPVSHVSQQGELFEVTCNGHVYFSEKIVVATGGCSYPTTGSDGKFFSILEELHIPMVATKPGLVPINVYNYPYKELSGISFKDVQLSLGNIHHRGDLLFTFDAFSGPAILSLSRYGKQNDTLVINYLPQTDFGELLSQLKSRIDGNSKQLATFLQEFFKNAFPKRFLEVLCLRLSLEPTSKASQLSGSSLKEIAKLLTADKFSISGLGGYHAAMVTCGGVSLESVDLKTLESKTCPNLYFIGEVLDVDGDTGGYNLQFAFSSAHLVAENTKI